MHSYLVSLNRVKPFSFWQVFVFESCSDLRTYFRNKEFNFFQFSLDFLIFQTYKNLFIFCLIIAKVKIINMQIEIFHIFTCMQKLLVRRSGWVVLNKSYYLLDCVMTVLVKICCCDCEQFFHYNGLKNALRLLNMILIRCFINMNSRTA